MNVLYEIKIVIIYNNSKVVFKLSIYNRWITMD
jgi:hypothetical protein